MAIFGEKKNTAVEADKKVAKKAAAPHVASNIVIPSYSTVIIRPRITEKATAGAEGNIYTFDVRKNATKGSVADAVRVLFKVTPRKVSIVPVRSKEITARGKRGSTRSGKKAYVYLRAGDKIEFV